MIAFNYKNSKDRTIAKYTVIPNTSTNIDNIDYGTAHPKPDAISRFVDNGNRHERRKQAALNRKKK